jgi:RNA-directed DNA polymerase
VVGDGTAGRFSDGKQGFVVGTGRRRSCPQGPKNRARPENRVSVVAEKRGNARGAKGHRNSSSVNDRDSEIKLAGVSEWIKQAEETRGQWPWVERSVWSERMLQALENGVKGGKWFSLIDKVWNRDNLSAAWMKAWGNQGSAGADGESIRQFTRQLDQQLERLQQELKEGRYRPQPVLRHWIPKPGSREKRPLGIPAVRDRIVQGAIRNVIEPIFERQFAEHSYGFRPGRGCKDALRRVEQLHHEDRTWVVDVDFQSYFDTIPHERLMKRVSERISDGRMLELIQQYLKAGVMDGMKGWEPTEQGTPQGAVISPLLANLYLNPLDRRMAEAGYAMTRYADDLVVQCRDEQEANAARAVIEEWAQENGLIVHPTKTRIVDATSKGGFDFLGYHFERGMKWPRQKSLDKFRETIRQQTRRNQGQNIGQVIARLNPVLRGWFEYFKHSQPSTFRELDGWIRGRLRSILRKYQGQKGRAKGSDHQRWPNAYFDQLGFYSLVQARERVLQSLREPTVLESRMR